ncbi:hypothetical protein Goshw_015371 [Gossypium schwendimanii]|uniref:Uncharacterized protein n=1 Tax=Gossypium schwendimanii TaxID=34291 RepID=A0A7J9LG59_GOSSC|nr:hypothetical protein [Gossypium schwendimanii]
MGNGVEKIIVHNVGNTMPFSAVCFLISQSVVNGIWNLRNLIKLTSFLLFTLTMLVRESYGEDIAETKTERSDKSEESEYGGSFIDDDDPEFVSSSQEFSGEGRRKKKYQISESENEGSSQQMDFTSGIAATVEVLDSELEVTLPISSLSASKSGKADVKEIARKK